MYSMCIFNETSSVRRSVADVWEVLLLDAVFLGAAVVCVYTFFICPFIRFSSAVDLP